MVADLVGDLVGELGPAVVHRQQDGPDGDPRIEVLPHQVDVVEQLPQPLERVVLALDGDEHLVAGDERVQGQQPQGRRAVDEHVVRPLLRREGVDVGLDGPAQPVLAGDDGDQLDLGAGEVDRRGDAQQLRAGGRRVDHLGQRAVADERVVDRGGADGVLDAEGGARVALRVEVDDQRPQPVERQGHAQVHRGRRLADAALLVGDRDDADPVRGREGLLVRRVEHAGGPHRLHRDRAVEVRHAAGQPADD